MPLIIAAASIRPPRICGRSAARAVPPPLPPPQFNGPGGAGRPDYVHVLPCPDTYRGLHLDGRAAARGAIAAARAAGGRIAAFFAESIISCGGQV